MEALLVEMAAGGASDLFVLEGRPPAVRVNGEVRLLSSNPTTRAEIEAFLQLVPGWLERFAAAGELDCGHGQPDGRRYRLHFSHSQGRLSLVARALPQGSLAFSELGLPDGVADLANAPRGLVLIAGATGSGKSTTLAAMVHHLNASRRVHILTIEDPIEFVHTDLLGRVTQREVGRDCASFGEALRQAVRQSPDVLVIGELRDADSVQAALAAALTGHLVLATLHTTDATQTVQRVMSFFPDHLRVQAALDLSIALRGVSCQRLIPAGSPTSTATPGPPRVVAIELLTQSPAVARLLREQRMEELQDLMRTDSSGGMVTFSQSLLALYRSKRISFEAGLAHASNPEEFALWARGMASTLDVLKEQGRATPDLDLRALLAHAQSLGASDLHLASGRVPMVRVAGRLLPLEGAAVLSDQDVRMLLFSIMGVRQRMTYELDREVDFALSIEGGQRFRVNAYFQKGRYTAALRAISSNIPDAAALRIPEGVLRLCERPHGLLLVVGPTGAGKSTTLACLVDRINRSRACRILTVEDPIEYLHPSHLATVDQREVGTDTRSFASALKYALRQDPDVILVGEMRDLETTSAALTAAETGHLVLATLHTNDAVQAIDRVIDIFPPHHQSQIRGQLASGLLGVVSQRLLPLREGGGRIAAFEVMVCTPAIRNVIRENKTHQAVSLMEASRKEGSLTLDQSLAELVSAGLVAPEEALRLQRPRPSLVAGLPRA